MDEPASGNAVVDDCENTHVINELRISVIALGIKDAVIAAIPNPILVSDKKKSSELKGFVADTRPMYERIGWGEYKVLDYKLHEDGKIA